MPCPSAPSKIFERDQKNLNVVKNFWTCSKFFGRVQKIWMWCKITKNGKNLKKKMCSKFLNMAKIFLNMSKTFQHIQNFLNTSKNFWTEQMDRALENVTSQKFFRWQVLIPTKELIWIWRSFYTHWNYISHHTCTRTKSPRGKNSDNLRPSMTI